MQGSVALNHPDVSKDVELTTAPEADTLMEGAIRQSVSSSAAEGG